jgi:hypothetical protein
MHQPERDRAAWFDWLCNNQQPVAASKFSATHTNASIIACSFRLHQSNPESIPGREALMNADCKDPNKPYQPAGSGQKNEGMHPPGCTTMNEDLENRTHQSQSSGEEQKNEGVHASDCAGGCDMRALVIVRDIRRDIDDGNIEVFSCLGNGWREHVARILTDRFGKLFVTRAQLNAIVQTACRDAHIRCSSKKIMNRLYNRLEDSANVGVGGMYLWREAGDTLAAEVPAENLERAMRQVMGKSGERQAPSS